MSPRQGSTSSKRPPRSAAEWTALACSCLVLAVLVGLIVVQLFGTRDPAAPVARVEGVPEVVGDLLHVDVTVTNEGDETAAEVQVTAELTVGDETTTADQTIDFLAGDEEVDLVFVFEEDPSAGDLSVVVSGFAQP